MLLALGVFEDMLGIGTLGGRGRRSGRGKHVFEDTQRQQHSSRTPNCAAAQDRGQHRENKGVQGVGGPDEVLRRTRQVRPAGHGHPDLGKPLQGQKAVHYIVVDAPPP
ncbi:hypothetical protein CRUP_028597, partial [Coryphaenoides rupestris]